MPTLDWIGKKAVLNHHRQVPYRLLHCDATLSAGDADAGNLLVQGDNLEALKALLPYYAGKVKCIYMVLPQNLWVETWGNRRRRFPQTPSWGFFPLTGLRRPARAKPALRMRAASRNPTKLGFALFPAAERLTGDADPRKVTHEFC